MKTRKRKITRSRMLGAIFVLSLHAYAQEFVKTKVFDKTPDQVFTAAEQVVRQNGISVLERDERTHTLRLRLASLAGTNINEKHFANYVVFTAEPDLQHSGKTRASLKVGHIDVPQNGFPPASITGHTQIPEPAFSKKFFKQLKKELNI
jgi:hypothetical protein